MDDTSQTTVALENDVLAALLPLVAEMNAALDRDALLRVIPQQVRRILACDLVVLFTRDASGHLALASAEPAAIEPGFRLHLGEGLVGTAARTGEVVFSPDVARDPRYVSVVDGLEAALAIPLLHQGQLVGVLGVEGRDRAAFTTEARLALQVLAVHLAVALANATLYEETRRYAAQLETLQDIGRETASLQDLDQLLHRIAEGVKRVIDYEMFGILLVDEESGDLVLRKSVRYCLAGQKSRIKLGEGFTGYAALHGVPVLAPDVRQDPRYLNLIPETRAELVVPLIHKDKVVGVFDLESTEVGRFDEEDLRVLTPLASQVAVTIDNARLYEELRHRDQRHTRELAIARRVQHGLLPESAPQGPGWAAAAGFRPAREVGGDLYDFYELGQDRLALSIGDVTGKGIPAALYAAFASGTVRVRALQGLAPAEVLASANRTLWKRGVEGRLCTLSMAVFDFPRRQLRVANSGLPYPMHFSAAEGKCRLLEVAGIPLGALDGTSYDELEVALAPGDAVVFVTDGVTEISKGDDEFGVDRLRAAIERHGAEPASELARLLLEEARAFGAPPRGDDMTIVAVKLAAE